MTDRYGTRSNDVLTRSGGEARVLFDMEQGLPTRNVIGAGDPDVHLIDGRWTMFLGAFVVPSFAVRIVQAQLPAGDELDSDRWRFTTGRTGAARTLFSPPRLRAWDSHGTHTPSFVEGPGHVRRIYYAGRATAANGGPSSRYAIGVVQLHEGRWRRRPTPVLVGGGLRRSVFEPLVRFEDGVWRMWHVAAPHEVGRGEQPDYELRVTESADGITGWSAPVPVFGSDEGYFDNALRRVADGCEMLVARGTNLYGTTPYPPQGLWWLRAEGRQDRRASWTSEPVPIVDAEHDPPRWMAAGAFGPEFHYGRRESDASTMYVFTSGTSIARPWRELAVERLRAGRLPPLPSPFTLNVGRLTIPRARTVIAQLTAGR